MTDLDSLASLKEVQCSGRLSHNEHTQFFFLFSLISFGVIEQVAIACESPSLGYQGDQAEMIR
jgi:hypothetical protein